MRKWKAIKLHSLLNHINQLKELLQYIKLSSPLVAATQSSTEIPHEHVLLVLVGNTQNVNVCNYIRTILNHFKRLNTTSLFPFFFFFLLQFTPCKAEQPLRGMELQEKKAQKILQATENLFKRNLQLKDVC